jgi:vanillate O-demethylase monooxygenase subunit
VHRRFPLSEGRRVGDTIACRYHGFTYDPDGTCVYVPGQQRIPRTARVRAYPVVEQDSFVWVWIGDPDRADATKIPRAPWFQQEGWAVVRGMEVLNARYGLLVDNLMDLSHETYLHGTSIGSPEVAESPITTEVDDENEIVYVSRRMDDAECPPFYARATGITGRITRWQDIEYHPPCLYLLHVRIAPKGHLPPAEGPDVGAFHVEIANPITPETEHTTLDFWTVARDFALDDPEIAGSLREITRSIIMEDIVALNRLEQHIAADPDGAYQELSINIDTGGLAARRLLRRQVEAGLATPAVR